MYETCLSRMTMQLPLAQMANRDGEAGMETTLWDINVIPNEQDNGYLMLPPGVLHMSALGRFGRFTLFSPRVSHSKHLPCSFCFVLCFGFGVFVALLCFCFLFCKCFGIPNSPRSLDLDDRQGLIASSAMQQKKKASSQPSLIPLRLYDRGTPAGREPNIEDIHHIDGSKPITETRQETVFLLRFTRLLSFPRTTVRCSAEGRIGSKKWRTPIMFESPLQAKQRRSLWIPMATGRRAEKKEETKPATQSQEENK